MNEATLRDALRHVMDPELDCNVVDLGLIYSVEMHGTKVVVKLTLTTPGCPMHESIAYGVQTALLELPGIDDVEVEVVWDPPWDPAMMTDAGRARLGLPAR